MRNASLWTHGMSNMPIMSIFDTINGAILIYTEEPKGRLILREAIS